MSIISKIYHQCLSGKKQLAILADPDKSTYASLKVLAELASEAQADYIFIGGSLLTHDNLTFCIETLKRYCQMPVVLFPGSIFQVDKKADAILLLSLISGRNPDLLIGQHVVAASMIRQSRLEVIPTGYIIIESGKITSVQYMSNTQPLPFDKPEIAVSTAIAGEMLGLKLIFIDAGSGALQPVPPELISSVKQNISIPLIVGGGIRTPESAFEIWQAGADIVTIGNAAETNPELILKMGLAKSGINAGKKPKNIKFV